MSYRVFLGLGSNLGQREKFLNNAVSSLRNSDDVKIVWYSSVYESDPFGNTEQPAFLNAVVEIETPLKPELLLERMKALEEKLGRVHSERWGPREIDIDILLCDGLAFENEELKVPHAEMEKRKFVLVPFRELAPDVVHPVNGMTVEELAQACKDGSRVVKSIHRIIA